MTESKNWRDVNQAADKLSVSPKTVYNLISTGKIKAHRMGTKRGYRISLMEIERYIRESAIGPMSV